MEENVYRVTLDEEEGSRDSEDENFSVDPRGSARLSDDFVGCNLSTPATSQLSGSGSIGKRKRCDAYDRKQKKGPASQQIANSLSVIACASEQRAAALNDEQYSISKIMTHLRTIDEIRDDPLFRCDCYDMVGRLKWFREMYVNLMDDQDELLRWLRHAVRAANTWNGPPA